MGNGGEIKDKPLIDSKKRNDLLDQIFRTKYEKLCWYAYRKTGSKEEASDIVTEAMLRFIQYQPPLREETTDAIMRYLCVTIKNLSIDAVKKRPQKAPLSLESELAEDFSLSKLIHGTAETAEEYALRQEEYEELSRAVSKLTPKQKEGLQMNYIQGLSYEEIARRMDISVEAARSLASRSIKKLRKILKGQEPKSKKEGG